jgi:succinate dehydrogenase / fumarate reductase iron-sulfur subunit
MTTAPVLVHRSGPRTPPRFDTFHLEIRPAQTVLDVLHTILEEMDPTLAFRRSCRSAICGSCAMRINGRSRLACNTQALDLVNKDGRLVVEPLQNHGVVRDLAVDMRPFWRSVQDVKPYLKEIPGEASAAGEARPNDAFASLRLVADCIFCASCVAECTVREANPDFLGPAALAKAYRFVGDPRDGATRERLERYSEPNGIWDCDTCLYCNEVCPKGVKPLDAILKMREAAVEEGIRGNVGARHALAFTETVLKSGKLNEATTAIRSLGIASFLTPGKGNFALTVKAAIKGKAPKLRKRPIKGMRDVLLLARAVRRKREAGRG